MTITEANYNLLNVITGGRDNNNNHYSLRNIEFTIRYYRALLARRDSPRVDPALLEQEIKLDMEIISPAEEANCGCPDDIFEFILRSTEKIPRPVHLKGYHDLTWAGCGTRKSFPIGRFYQEQFRHANKYTSNDTSFVYHLDGYVYLAGDPTVAALSDELKGLTPACDVVAPVDEILVRAVFENPREVPGFDPVNDDYPITGDLYQRITQSLLNGELRFMRETPSNTEVGVLEDAKAQ